MQTNIFISIIHFSLCISEQNNIVFLSIYSPLFLHKYLIFLTFHIGSINKTEIPSFDRIVHVEFHDTILGQSNRND